MKQAEESILLCSLDSNLFGVSCYHARVTWDFNTGSLWSQHTLFPTTCPLQKRRGEKNSSLAAGGSAPPPENIAHTTEQAEYSTFNSLIKKIKIILKIVVHLSCCRTENFLEDAYGKQIFPTGTDPKQLNRSIVIKRNEEAP